MNAITSAAIMAACAFVVGCQSPEARLPDPDRLEAQKGVARLLTATNHSYSIIVPAGQPTQCAPGKMGDVDVRTCNVCVLGLFTVNEGFGNWRASVTREVHSVAFKRAQSFDQADIAPATPGSGVWVSIIPASPIPYAPPKLSRTIQEQVDIDGPRAADLLGYRYSSGMAGDMFFDEHGYVNRGEIPERLTMVPKERWMPLVGGCSAG